MTTRVMKQMRVVVVTDEGKQYEAVAPFEPPITDQEGWFPIGIALGAFKGLSPDAKIKEIRVFGDAYGVFYVARYVWLPTPPPSPGTLARSKSLPPTTW
jgi:hypothetical protein